MAPARVPACCAAVSQKSLLQTDSQTASMQAARLNGTVGALVPRSEVRTHAAVMTAAHLAHIRCSLQQGATFCCPTLCGWWCHIGNTNLHRTAACKPITCTPSSTNSMQTVRHTESSENDDTKHSSGSVQGCASRGDFALLGGTRREYRLFEAPILQIRAALLGGFATAYQGANYSTEGVRCCQALRGSAWACNVS
jgi:hypothetical protein